MSDLRGTGAAGGLSTAAGAVGQPIPRAVWAAASVMVLLLPLWFQIRLGASSASTGLLLVLGLGTTASAKH